MISKVGDVVAYRGKRDYIVVEVACEKLLLSDGSVVVEVDPQETSLVLTAVQLNKEFPERYPFE
jgi:hypothetical protein